MAKEKLTHFPAFRETYIDILELPGALKQTICCVLHWDEKTFDDKISSCMLSEKELAMIILAFSHLSMKTFGTATNPASNVTPN